MDLESECYEKLENFKRGNKEFLKNPIIVKFLSTEENYKKFVSAICKMNTFSHEELDNAFKKFYFQIRFTAYISTTIHFHAINLDKKIRQTTYRFPLQLDQPIKNNPTLLPKDLIGYYEDFTVNSNDILEYISDPLLYHTVKKLTLNQREILYLSYVKELTDSEISVLQKKTQQAVSKARKKALEKIKFYLDKNTES